MDISKMGIQKRSTRIITMAAMCMPIISGVFIEQKQSSFIYPFATETVRSVIECCLKCKDETLCNSVNYCPTDKTCEFNNRGPTDFQNGDVVATPNKDMYYISIDPCSGPWILYRRHCYIVVTTEQTWEQSEDNCNQMGAYLTDIVDEFENTFVRQLGDDAGAGLVWLGMGNYHTVIPRVWTSGQPLHYTNFRDGEPSGGNEDCLHLYEYGKWNDRPCDALIHSVCKKRQY